MLENIIIRKADMSDIPFVMELLEQTDFLTADAQYDTPEYFECSVNDGIFFVAEYESNIIGLIHGEKLIHKGSVIWYFVVDKKYRSRGIGKLLLNKFEKHCLESGIKWVFGSSDINKKTLSFYKRNGYDLEDTYIEFKKSL